ncbi:flagellar hook-basal body protein [Fontisphaera persica]|uniref:flagellar hook-basal body protein n=1 Tax=Fontisphaera persica TaxID=2974023 RepID=UPI0024BF7E19|nr:flagellar hook-basal body protein [Fontisphaera persica]WCJ58206.1 flagellar hook-basal body protein [Fontisphaera persica]
MNVSLYQASAAMNAATRWQELIAENLAGAPVTGYKKRELSTEAVQAGLMLPGNQPAPVFLLPHATSELNLQQGELRRTGVATDVAIEGPGFFEVQMPNGSPAYTRNGEFRLTAQGQLITKGGQPVMGETGPIQIDTASGEPVTITASGEVSQGGVVRGKLKVVEFDQPHLLTPAGAGLFTAQNPQLQARPAAVSTVCQGFLEASNISPTLEMANLIVAMRQFETAQRVIQMQDERMGRTIAELSGNG